MTPNTTQAPAPYAIHTDAEARAMLHGAGATVGKDRLWVTIPPTTPIYDLICAGQRLGYEVGSTAKTERGTRLEMVRS
jgi:hypothetical protein